MPCPLKRASPGRIGRLLASLRPPAHAGPLPVQTGFPTSLADLVVKNHDRLRKPKKRRPSTAAPPAVAAAAAVEPPPGIPQAQSGAPCREAAAFRLRPDLLALGGAVALELMVIWSKRLVLVVTAASLSLLWVESVRSASQRRPRQRLEEPEAAAAALLGLRDRSLVSPIREVESEAETPRSSSAGSDKVSEVSSLWAGNGERSDLFGDDSINPKGKAKRSLRKLIAKKLHGGKKQPRKKDPSANPPAAGAGAAELGSNASAVKTEALLDSTEPTPSESSREEEEELDGRGGALPQVALLPVLLVGLIAGKLPAVALTVLCVIFSIPADRLPAR